MQITGSVGDDSDDVVERRAKQSAETSSQVIHSHHHALHRERRLRVRKLQRYNAPVNCNGLFTPPTRTGRDSFVLSASAV